MKVSCVQYDVNSFGITQRSLKMLRNALASRINHYVAVVEVPTSDLCCGYMILDQDEERAIWTGDGFRLDERGEGGAGYKSAKALLQIYGVWTFTYTEKVDFDKVYSLPKDELAAFLKELATNISADLSEGVFMKLSDNTPQYLRG